MNEVETKIVEGGSAYTQIDEIMYSIADLIEE